MRLLKLAPLFLAAACGGPVAEPILAPTAGASVDQSTTTTRVQLNSDNVAAVHRVREPVERVWSVMPFVYAEVGVPVAHNDPDAKHIGNRRLVGTRIAGEPASHWVRCANQGTGAGASTTYRVQMSVMTAVRPSSTGGSEVVTTVAGTATPVEGTSSAAIHCVSTGRMELLIAQAVSRRAPT